MSENTNGSVKEKKKTKGERRRSSAKQQDDSLAVPPSDVPHYTGDEIKKFKESLLQKVADGESIMSSERAPTPPPTLDDRTRSRSRSVSRARRDSMFVPENVRAELDETKLFELKEAFLLFDMDGDGCIDHGDLRATLISLGESIDENAVHNMLAEAPNPLDFDGFVNLLGYKTLELDSEATLVDALSRWDKDNSGYISEDRIRHDLMTWGDRFTEKEAEYALDEAPTVYRNGQNMIDYVRFCSQLAGLRKGSKKDH